MNFFIARDGEQQGPFTQEQIREGLKEGGWLRTEDLIWHEGLEDWRRVDEVFEVRRVQAPAGEPGYAKATTPVAPFAAEPGSGLPARTRVMTKKAPPMQRPGQGGPPGVRKAVGKGAVSSTPAKGKVEETEPRRKGGLSWVIAVILLVVAGLLAWLGISVAGGNG